MDLITIFLASVVAAVAVAGLRGLRRRRNNDPVQRLNFDLYKKREMGRRGLAGKF